MPRARTPLAKAEATGRTIHDPQRFRDRKEPSSGPLGEPPRMLKTKLELEAWEILRRRAGAWLRERDEPVAAVWCRLHASLTCGNTDLKVYDRFLTYSRELGLTPSSASKVHVPDAEESDPADKYIN